ncbi:MAG TPA: hypothetical protein VKV15_10820 [Bryobacteraceae bacterium]|nr:hypothetical protein [Bryobacteraceae bacterium]
MRDRVRLFLREHSYRKSGGVTIDISDWYYDARFRQRLQADPSFDATRFREPYLAHLWDRAQYYDQVSQTCLGRSVHHILLTHYTLLNALFLSDVIRTFESRGWSIVSAEEAFADPVFERKPDTIPAGESLLWRLPSQSGKFPGRLRHPGEDGPYEKPVLDRLGL